MSWFGKYVVVPVTLLTLGAGTEMASTPLKYDSVGEHTRYAFNRAKEDGPVAYRGAKKILTPVDSEGINEGWFAGVQGTCLLGLAAIPIDEVKRRKNDRKKRK